MLACLTSVSRFALTDTALDTSTMVTTTPKSKMSAAWFATAWSAPPDGAMASERAVGRLRRRDVGLSECQRTTSRIAIVIGIGVGVGIANRFHEVVAVVRAYAMPRALFSGDFRVAKRRRAVGSVKTGYTLTVPLRIAEPVPVAATGAQFKLTIRTVEATRAAANTIDAVSVAVAVVVAKCGAAISSSVACLGLNLRKQNVSEMQVVVTNAKVAC